MSNTRSGTRGNREGERWWARSPAQGAKPPLPLGNFVGYEGPPRIGDAALTWDVIDWIRSRTDMKLLLKGIVTGEDAGIAARRGVDGIVVSNQGGRQEESLRATLTCLPEVVAEAGARMPVLIDGGGVIYESAIINEYLEEKFPAIPLLPRDPLQRAQIRIWIDFLNIASIPPPTISLMARSRRAPAPACSTICARWTRPWPARSLWSAIILSPT